MTTIQTGHGSGAAAAEAMADAGKTFEEPTTPLSPTDEKVAATAAELYKKLGPQNYMVHLAGNTTDAHNTVIQRLTGKIEGCNHSIQTASNLLTKLMHQLEQLDLTVNEDDTEEQAKEKADLRAKIAQIIHRCAQNAGVDVDPELKKLIPSPEDLEKNPALFSEIPKKQLETLKKVCEQISSQAGSISHKHQLEVTTKQESYQQSMSWMIEFLKKYNELIKKIIEATSR